VPKDEAPETVTIFIVLGFLLLFWLARAIFHGADQTK
jgi:hypothetical protein